MRPFRRPSAWVCAVLFLLWLPSAVAAQTTGQAAPQIPASPVSLGSLLQVLFGLVLVLAAVAGTAWLLKRLAPGQVGMGGIVKVVGGVAVGPKERLVLVEVGDTWLVLGVAPGRVSAVHNMPKPQETVGLGGDTVAEGGFASWLKQATQRRQEK
jgi:flagellar protein FliO/FliZ